jgi:hypothetical protein
MQTPKLQNKEKFGGKPMIDQGPFSKAEAEVAKKKIVDALESESDPEKRLDLEIRLKQLEQLIIVEDKSS